MYSYVGYFGLELSVLVFLYQTGAIDDLTLMDLARNTLAHYTGVVMAEIAVKGYPTPKAFLTPVEGIFIATKYVAMAKPPAERSARLVLL
jgi:hypothetical protein